MNVFIHYPMLQEDILELKNKIAKIHAQAVITYLQNLDCPLEQKFDLLKKITEPA